MSREIITERLNDYKRRIRNLEAQLEALTRKSLNDTRLNNERVDHTHDQYATNSQIDDALFERDFLDLEENASPGTPTAGTVGRLYAEDVAGFTTVDWRFVVNGVTYDIDILRDGVHVVKNESGATLTKGTVVNAVGSTGNFATVEKLDAKTNDDDASAYGLIYEDIDDNNFGIVLTVGDLENFDTSSFSAGEFLYVHPSSPGMLTNTRPTGRDRVYPIGEVIKANVAGTVEVKIKAYIDNDFRSLHYSTFMEQIDVSVSSAGGVITVTLDNEQGENYLQAFFSNGKTILTPPLTVDTNGTLTAGTDSVPQLNFIYILASAPSTLVASTSGWPTAEHIRCATVNLLSAATTATDGGAFTNQVWNDEPSFEGSNPRGHLAHIGERIRASGTEWDSGVAGAGLTSGYITVTGGNAVYFLSGAGVVYQFHKQTFPAFDSQTDDVFVKNDNTTPYNRINDLRAGITADSTGTSIPNNRYFSLVFWGVVNEDSTNDWIGVNLPSGVYQSANAARVDRDKHDDYSIPDQFKGVAFLICRITFQKTSTTWIVQSTDDLRGQTTATAQGSFGAALQTEFLTSNHRLLDPTDPTKQLAHDLSGLTTNTLRTWTVQDKDITVAGLSDLYADSDVESYLEGQGYDPSAGSFSTDIAIGEPPAINELLHLYKNNSDDYLIQVEQDGAGAAFIKTLRTATRFWGFGTMTDSHFIIFDNVAGKSSPQFDINQSNGDIIGTHGTYHTSSDRRNKSNVISLDELQYDALSKLMKLQPVRFNWDMLDNPSNDAQIGFIAQDVELVDEYLVNPPNSLYNKHDYSLREHHTWEALIIKAMQELKTEKDAEIEDLKNRIKQLEDMIL